jgi:hypothetical protein
MTAGVDGYDNDEFRMYGFKVCHHSEPHQPVEMLLRFYPTME